MYEKTQERLSSVELQVSKLQQQIACTQHDSESSNQTGRGKKRKASKLEPEAPSSLAAKTVLNGCLSIESIVLAEADQEDDCRKALLHDLFQLRGGIAQTTNTQSLAYNLVSLAKSISATMTKEIAGAGSIDEGRVEALRSSLTCLHRSVAMLLAGDLKLACSPDAGCFQGRVTYAIVQMFQSFLETLDALGSMHVEKARSSRPMRRTKTSAECSKISPSLGLLTSMIESCITELDASKTSHAVIFEGLTYFVLEHLGRDLHIAIFNCRVKDSLELDIEARLPGDMRSTSGSTANAPSGDDWHDRARLGVTGPYMLHLLRCIMTRAPAYMNVRSVHSGKPNRMTTRTSAKDILIAPARERLQRTLLKCFDGAQVVDEDDPFEDCLSRPLPPPISLQKPKVKGIDGDKWFVFEAWNLVGWEILTKDHLRNEH